MGTLPIGPGKAAKAAISASVHAHKLITTKAGAEKLIGIGTRTATRNFIGRPGTTGKWATKLFNSIGPERARVATRFATNTKSTKLTGAFLGKAAGAIAIIGTYPFAKFELAESMDKIGIAMFSAMQAEDWDTVAELAQIQQEMSDPSMTDKIFI